ncbi:MAG: hypothetical protein JWN67_1417 [Actinomycetia bacterium]|nr:hypothetical protein [Actinomycetes bacterium]
MGAWAPILEGKVALVVGGGTGNGSGTVRALARAGARVAVADIDQDRADALGAEVGGVGLRCDVRDPEQILATVAGAVDALGRLDVLVTVVGGHTLFAPWAPLGETTDEDWDLIVDVNLRYVFRFARAALNVFLEQGTGGSIVAIGSISGSVSSPYAAAYGAAKAGLANLAKSVAGEYARDGIRMNVVACGAIATETAAAVDSVALGFTDRIPMGRLGSPEEVGDTVVFLASPLASYISGQTLTVDGVLTARFPTPVPKAPTYTAG